MCEPGAGAGPVLACAPPVQYNCAQNKRLQPAQTPVNQNGVTDHSEYKCPVYHGEFISSISCTLPTTARTTGCRRTGRGWTLCMWLSRVKRMLLDYSFAIKLFIIHFLTTIRYPSNFFRPSLFLKKLCEFYETRSPGPWLTVGQVTCETLI